MSLFRDQPGYCCVCGRRDIYPFKDNRPVICSTECWGEFHWRNTLYILGQEYRPAAEPEPVTP